MFGTLRTILAIMVLVGHLTDQWQIGTYAVFAFYMISGYLMTHIMQENYGYSGKGRRSFAFNRFLRLYPSYWVVLLGSVLTVLIVGSEFAKSYNKLISIPASAGEWLSAVSMIYLGWFPDRVSPNLAPTTWAITIELFFYLCIALGLSKTKKRVIIWLTASMLYVAYCQLAQLPWPHKYYPIPAASLPFAIGAFIYFRKKEGYLSLSDSWITSPAMLSILLIANAVATLLYPDYFQTGFYTSFLISVVLCYEIALGRRWPLIGKKLDTAIGDYSYPIYLMHWQVGMVVSYFVFDKVVQDASIEGYSLTLASLFLSALIASLLIHGVDKPLRRFRAGGK